MSDNDDSVDAADTGDVRVTLVSDNDDDDDTLMNDEIKRLFNENNFFMRKQFI